MDKIKRIDELVLKLNQAIMVYEQGYDEIMTNAEYDRLYDELHHLEIETGYVSKHSPIRKVGYEVVSGLPKVKHKNLALSLDKTKDINAIVKWLGDEEGLLSFKLDGLTLILEYFNGKLVSAVTRGNGEVGEDVTHNAKVMDTIPNTIEYNGKLTIRGEAMISYEDFDRINAILPDDEKYKNPRNLASGSIRQLDSSVCKYRNVAFIAFEVVDGFDSVFTNKESQLLRLGNMGFYTVWRKIVTKSNVEDISIAFENNTGAYAYPVDGLVLTYNDIAYSNSLPMTSKFPKHSIALKWKDESVETTLRSIEWNTSRTGLINPVAIFDPIEIEGSTVGRASLHNISIIEGLQLKLGDRIGVIKANMIIPQILENYDANGEYSTIHIPSSCPSCGGYTEVRQAKDSKTLHCVNDSCNAKILGKLVHFCKRDAMNIEGLSEATLEKLIESNLVRDYEDIFKLEKYRSRLIKLDGFGVKSIDKLLINIKSAEQVELPKFTYALGVENIGRTASKILSEHYNYDTDKMFSPSFVELSSIDGIGQVASNSFIDYLNNKNGKDIVNTLLFYVTIIKPEAKDESN
ncbi:MAG TPA: NAD-dependent DNA ligase LigA, partial [Tissierellaceae bacterium]|nr:NAD-dependent DNA ligase LigA [Tissierellaceae bacterium]